MPNTLDPDTVDKTFKPLKDMIAVEVGKHSQLWLSWHFLQVFSHWGIRLPTSESDFKALMGNSPTGYAFFPPMQEGTKYISDTCDEFLKKTYPGIVRLGNDLLNYSKNASPGDGALFEEVAKMIDENDTKNAVTLLSDLQNTAKDCGTRAEKQAENLAKFSAELVKALGKLAIAKTALDKDEKTNEDTINKLAGNEDQEGSLANYNKKIRDLRAEYNQQVVIAATTPTYAWVWPIGTIPAIVVAGICTDRAIKKLKEVDALDDELRKKDTSLFAANQARRIYSVGHDGLTNVTAYTQQAQAHCTIVQNAWAKISGNIEDLIQNINNTTSTTADGGLEPKSKALLKIYLNKVGAAWNSMKPGLEDLTKEPYVVVQPGTKTPGEFAGDMEKAA